MHDNRTVNSDFACVNNFSGKEIKNMLKILLNYLCIVPEISSRILKFETKRYKYIKDINQI